jgi:hypothetical protein
MEDGKSWVLGKTLLAHIDRILNFVEGDKSKEWRHGE